MSDKWYKNKKTDVIWWKDTPEDRGLWIFSFDRKKEFNMFEDYPFKLSEDQIRVFDSENPEWAQFFSDRKR